MSNPDGSNRKSSTVYILIILFYPPMDGNPAELSEKMFLKELQQYRCIDRLSKSEYATLKMTTNCIILKKLKIIGRVNGKSKVS